MTRLWKLYEKGNCEHLGSIIEDFVIDLRLKVTYSNKDHDIKNDEVPHWLSIMKMLMLGLRHQIRRIYPIFDEIIIKRSQISDSKKIKFQAKKITKPNTKNYDNKNTLNSNNKEGYSYNVLFLMLSDIDDGQRDWMSKYYAWHKLVNQLYDLTQKCPLKNSHRQPERIEIIVMFIPEVTDLRLIFTNVSSIKEDIKQGTKFFKEAADEEVADSQLPTENGNVTAQFNLSEMYFADVVGLNRDKEKGLQCSKVADLRVI
ncbi:hypothetical protein RhiirA4_479286 [Rhizophagus irregularis]|uniref:Uncharacterized protein n=1 Tax=Rhizophagus irregularis TaxID=588596 RepID=A0A2I1HG82_9GLOM|nr:hypothetical protein RhiirA4_479286 [Rhizophagus irregularis]